MARTERTPPQLTPNYSGSNFLRAGSISPTAAGWLFFVRWRSAHRFDRSFWLRHRPGTDFAHVSLPRSPVPIRVPILDEPSCRGPAERGPNRSGHTKLTRYWSLPRIG